MRFLLDLLKRLESEGFFGSVEVKFESGRPVILRKEETFKLVSRDKWEIHDQTSA
jgi:hypothetical protein